jgi:plasmid stabilization system protein ParE
LEFTIELLNKAKLELAESVDWYNKQRIGLGIEFAKAIQKKLNLIEKYPERYSKIKNSFRQVSIEKFPYCIVYFIEKLEKKIIITSIFHHSRNPKKKLR